MATHSSILAQRIPWREEPGGLQSTGSQRVGHDQSDLAHIVSKIKNTGVERERSRKEKDRVNMLMLVVLAYEIARDYLKTWAKANRSSMLYL